MRIVPQKWNLVSVWDSREFPQPFLSTGGHSEKMVICELGSLSPPNTKSDFLILDSEASRTMRNEHLSFKHPWIFLLEQPDTLTLPIPQKQPCKINMTRKLRRGKVRSLVTAHSCLVALIGAKGGAYASLPAPQRQLTTGMMFNLYLNIHGLLLLWWCAWSLIPLPVRRDSASRAEASKALLILPWLSGPLRWLLWLLDVISVRPYSICVLCKFVTNQPNQTGKHPLRWQGQSSSLAVLSLCYIL